MWFAIFKAGTQTDSAGNTKDWTEDDLDTIVEKYNNQAEGEEHRAPIVIGHPIDSSPAYGWIDKLKRDGDTLYAKARDVAKEFVDWFKKGMYRERSVSLYPDLTLEHVGFLGGVPPAVKGLPPVPANAFADATKSVRYAMQFADSVVKDEQTAMDAAFPSANQETQTVEQAKAAQLERSKLFSIRPSEKGNITKPGYYAALKDAEYGDPVNYLFPCGTYFQTLAALRSWGSGYGYDYTETEKQIILERMLERAQLLGIPIPMDKVFYYSQRLNFTQGGQAMLDQFIEWLKTAYPGTDTADQTASKIGELQTQMVTDLLAWLESTFGADIKTAAEAKLQELQNGAAAAPAPADAQQATTASQATASNHSQHNDALARVAVLEKERRTEKFEQFAKGLGFGGVQLTNAITQLENAHILEAENKVAGAVESTKQFLQSSAPAVVLQEFASGKRVDSGGRKTRTTAGNVDPARQAQADKIQKYADEHNMSFAAALTKLSQEGEL